MSTYTHQTHTTAAPLVRSGSFFGTIKNIVTAPFNWFTGPEDEFEDTKGKRRRLPVTSDQGRPEDDSLQGRTKRMRVSGPDRDMHPYLDPPRSAFQQPQRTSGYSRHLSKSPRKSLHIPTASAASNQSPRNRRTLSPHPSASHLKPPSVTRTMSLDPPPNSSFSSRIQPAPTMQDIQLESDHTRDLMSISRDVSMSPRHLRVRSSLTPQPSGTSFGPVVPPRRERDPNEPPPLTALMSNPMFVKPPPGLQKPGAAELGKQLTLGSLMDSHRKAHTPVRQSSILFGTGSMTDVSAPGHLWPVNAAEIALQELEVYKTPLLPTRLKGSATIPDMFVHKEKKQITLMTDDRPVKPRLGTKGKGKDKSKKKAKEAINGTKPYAGEGGMKKWLARRKREVEEAKDKDEAEAMEDERAEEQRRKDAEAHEKKREQELRLPPPPPPSVPAFAPRPARETPLTSSLRVGRTRTGRNHIDRPVSRHPGKFSAVFEDEDEEMDEGRAAEQKALEEAAKKVPVFELPAGFTFAKEAPIAHDLMNAKEPPITALPFSLTKPAPPSVPPAPMVAEPVKPVQAPPTFSFAPPTPEPAKSAAVSDPLATMVAPPAAAAPAPATAPSGIPNFFANSSIFAKPTAVVAPPSVPLIQSTEEPPKPEQKAPEFSVPKAPEVPASLFGAPPRPAGTSLFGTPPAPAAPVGPSLFGTSPAANGTSLFGAPSIPAAPKETEKPAPTLAPPFSFAEPAKSAEPAQAPASSAPVELPKATEPPKHATPFGGTPFSFGAPASAAPVTTTEAPNGGLTFSQSTAAPATTRPAPAIEIPKAPFSTQPSTTTFSFDQRPSTAPTGEKPASSGFSFTGTSSTAEKRPAPGFTFGTPTTPTAAPAATPAFSFGGTPSGSTAADVSSKPFSFGQTTPARAVTPPKVDQEVTMDESPTRDIVPNGNGKAPQRPSLSFSFATPSTSAPLSNGRPSTAAPAFSFGQNATLNPFAKEEKTETKPAPSFGGFGQTLSTGFAFGQNAPESPAVTSPAAGLFQFGQPSPSVAPASPFTFGPSGATAFGQPSTASAPASPSTFNRPTPGFAFGTPTTPQPASNPFGFGAASQPTSPANGNATLPSGTSGGATFTFGATPSATAAPAAQNAFGAPAPATAPGGGSLFTMGSAPPAAEGAGARRIKGLPRRGGRR